MNILFLSAIIFAVALVQGGQTAEKANGVIQPCQEKDSMTRYKEFVRRHILSEKFDRQDLKKWEGYLIDNKLCGRVPVQSFIDGDKDQVKQICRRGGRRVSGATGPKGNLCISKSKMTVYDVKSRRQKNKCNITSVETENQPVVLACNKVNNQCLPVHYEKYSDQSPDNRDCM